TTAEAEAGQPTHLLSTFTTHHACCQTRVHNIQRLADLVDGAIVQPGEQFTINQISGERSCSRGFVEAGMIRRGEIVPACGGGVSQFGTTTYNAAYFAGQQLDAWKAHSFYISRYPMGREATINYPSPDIDVLWTNVTGAPILVKTSYTATSITVSFWGRSDVDEVQAVHGSPTRWRNWTTEYRENKNLKPGTQRTIQSGQRGFTVVVTRRVHRGNDVKEDEIVTVYQPEREIIERNSDPAPSPTPTPEPTPTPDPPSEPPPPEPTDDETGQELQPT
ncbi:MAG TPA: VanW family protein, partial [Nitriliruptorales bacterium]